MQEVNIGAENVYLHNWFPIYFIAREIADENEIKICDK